MGFPFEIITMLGSTLLSSLLSIWSQSRKAKADEQKLLITRGEFEMKAVQQAREVKDKGFTWTRRIIALTAIFAIVLLPKLVAVFYPTVDVTVGYTNWMPGFWFFKEGREVFEWVTFSRTCESRSSIQTCLGYHGMYFGGSLVKK